MHRPSSALDPQPSVWVLALPSMMTYAAFALRQFTDTFMVGRLGTEPLAAILPAQQMLFVIQSFGHGLAAALNTCASQRQVKHGTREAGIYCWQSIWLALIAGIAASQIYWIASPLMALFGHDLPVYQFEVAYLRIAIWAVIPQFVSVALSNFFFAIRRPEISMWFGIGYVAVNVVANRILIFGVGEFIPAQGMTGAAWGTIAAALFLVLSLLGVFLFSPSLAEFRPRRPSISWKRIKHLLGIGPFNAAIDVIDILFWNVGIIFFIGQFGSAHLAAAAIMVAILDLVIFPIHGVFVALTTTVGYQSGGRHFDKAFRDVRQTAFVSVAISVALGIALYFCSPLLYNMISDDELVGRIGQRCMAILPFILLFSTWFYVIDGGLNGAGDARFPFGVLLVSNFIVIAGGGFLCVRYLPDLGSYGIWICVMVNRGVIAIIGATRWHSGAWKKFAIPD